MILQILKKQTNCEFTPEFKFLEKRKFRFDFAHIESRTAIEIEGGAFTRGRHTRGVGFIGDMEKYNLAISESWAVLRFTPSQMNESKTYELIKKVVELRLTK